MPNETQDTVGKWIQDTFSGTDPESPRKSLRALEEMIELCLASGATPAQIAEVMGRVGAMEREKGPYQDVNESRKQSDRIPIEAADVLIVLYGVAHMRGFDLHEQVDKKMLVNRSRKWKANGDGTGYHIKEQPANENH